MTSAYIQHSNIISPLGFNTAENFTSVCQGISGVKDYSSSSQKKYYAAALNNTLLDAFFCSQTKCNPLYYTRAEKMSILSAQDVINTSNIEVSNPRTLFIFSTTKGNVELLENKSAYIPENRIYLYETAHAVSLALGFKNKPLVISNACISGLLALIVAKRLIENNQYDSIIITGVDVLSDFILSGFNSLNALSTEACKPFDKDRSGINLGEAAATVLLSKERKEKSVRMEAAYSSNDANHISGPSRTGEGLYQCLQKIQTKNTPDFINAHGTATIYNDEMEAVAFSRAGLQGVPVASFKNYYGHTLGAAGVVESILCVESLRQEKMIASKGFEKQGTSVALNVIQNTHHKKSTSCIKTASGFGGCNAVALYTI
ncbi:MAG: beta-ketoacyl synthase [Bacteroidetes bacterium]|nr:beta-ketoacyl synthase [Bacteroidota bacterium]